MIEHAVEHSLVEWDSACDANDRDRWVEHLDRVAVCDFFSLLVEREALTKAGKLLPLARWLNYMGARSEDDIVAEAAWRDTPPHVKLACATYLRWRDRIETLLKTSPLPNLPNTGVLQYFVDHLAASVLVGYKRIGSTVQLQHLLAVPNPEAYLDPLRALNFAETPAQLELLRRSLYSRHKVVVQRNTLLHIDRERASDVFGPSIDTLFLNDWLHTHRYALQRTQTNEVFFENPVPERATSVALSQGCRFLEIGCGNGLLTASFSKNEAKISSFTAVDVSHAAVTSTYENVKAQRQLHGHDISAHGHFITGRYDSGVVSGSLDLVVCNPPYIPALDAKHDRAHPLATATIGTELLTEVLRDSPKLLAPDGELLMISSTLAQPEISAALPTNMNIEQVGRRLVPFDIEAIRGEHEAQHIAWLRAARGLEERGNTLMHNIAVYRVTHARTGGN